MASSPEPGTPEFEEAADRVAAALLFSHGIYLKDIRLGGFEGVEMAFNEPSDYTLVVHGADRSLLRWVHSTFGRPSSTPRAYNLMLVHQHAACLLRNAWVIYCSDPTGTVEFQFDEYEVVACP